MVKIIVRLINNESNLQFAALLHTGAFLLIKWLTHSIFTMFVFLQCLLFFFFLNVSLSVKYIWNKQKQNRHSVINLDCIYWTNGWIFFGQRGRKQNNIPLKCELRKNELFLWIYALKAWWRQLIAISCHLLKSVKMTANSCVSFITTFSSLLSACWDGFVSFTNPVGFFKVCQASALNALCSKLLGGNKRVVISERSQRLLKNGLNQHESSVLS